MTKKAIIFDLNGVFITSPKLSERFEKDFHISSDIFLPALMEIMDKVRRPNTKSLYVFWRPYFENGVFALKKKSF